MPTRKRHQLDVNLSHIEDGAVRDALVSIIGHVNGLSQDTIVSGSSSADTFETNKKNFTVRSDGTVHCRGINFRDGGTFQVVLHGGTIASLGDELISISSDKKIFGVVGFATRAGDTSIWRPISYEYPVGQGIRFESGTTAGTSNSVRLTSNNSVDSDIYRLVIFYTEV